MDFQVVGGEAVADAVGPFDEGEAGGVEVFLGAELEELVFVAEAVGVDVVDGKAAGVFVHQDEGGAGGLVGGDAEGGGDGLDEARFAGAERADEGDGSSRREGGGEGGAEALGLLFVAGEEGERLHGNHSDVYEPGLAPRG